jgi:predicted ATPase
MVVSRPVSFGRKLCSCHEQSHVSQLIAVTGGPGAGKTAILDAARQVFCQHVVIVPEAATIVFSGGFWRLTSEAGRRSAQRAIFHVQRQLETILAEDRLGAVGLCDRGTVDGAAYWPGSEESYWSELGTSRAQELARYAAVIHLRTPPAAGGYNQQNPFRIESARVAAELDERIFAAWANHPRRTVVEADDSFATKLERALEVITEHMPPCCRNHPPAPAKADPKTQDAAR